MNIRKKEFIYSALIFLIAMTITMILIEIPKIERELKNNVKQDMILTISVIIDNFDRKLGTYASKNSAKSLADILENDPLMRSELESDLAMIISPDIKYSYVLFRDSNHKYRFMLDGASQDKSEFGMKFDTENSVWDKAYKTRQPQLFEQKNLHSLWITYLKPIIIDNKVQGIIAVDFSLEGHQDIINITKPLHKYIWMFVALLAVGIIISGIQFLFFHLSQKRVYIDPLTGLYNRHFFNDIISTIDYQKYAIVMMDLDKFKIINDTYGHDIGDDVLKSVSTSLKTSIREHDKLIRYGGEEFLLYISMHDLDHVDVIEILEQVRKNIELINIKTGIITINPTISIGVNSYTSHFKSEHDAISMADKMLYQAKQTGRNKICIYTPSKSTTENSIHFLNVHHVKEAIEEKRVFCEYQPIVDLEKNEIMGYEALVRIRDDDDKIYYPGMFLSNIAHSNIYKELTMELLRINFTKVHAEQCYISINLNITDILDDDIYNRIINHLTQTKKEAEYLTFELLEEEQITNLEELKKRIDNIRLTGSKISLDDFGSGYSNFSHIFALNIDTIKIDGSLIKDIHTSEISYKLVESIVAFALASEKKVIAEYIHSFVVMQIVKKLGILHGQGFYLGKPSETLATASAHI